MDPRTYEKIDSIPIDSVYTPIAIDLGEYVDEDTKDTLRPYYIVTPEDVLGLRMPREMEEIKGEDPFFEPMAAAAGTGGGGLGGQQGLPPPQAIYYLYDHLGNTRITFHADVCTGSGTGISYYLDQVADYFPYGKLLREYRPSSLVVNNGIGQMVQQAPDYLTTQHERDEESGFDYRGARFYDSDLGRFLSVDPLAADYAGWSGYGYVLGNPVTFIDPSGRAPEGPIYGPDGTLIGYEVEAGQGPSQIAHDLNQNYNCQMICEVAWEEIVYNNAKSFQNVFDGNGKIEDAYNGDYKSGNIKPGDNLIITNGIPGGQYGDKKKELENSIIVKDGFQKEVDSLKKEWRDLIGLFAHNYQQVMQ